MIDFRPDFSKSLNKGFFENDTITVAKELLGKVLVRELANGEVIAGIIVETEAYLAENDLACHAAVKKTKRNSVMFLSGGYLYVYKIYGIHHCVNIVSETEGRGCAVLLRAVEPVAGFETMRKYRGNKEDKELCNGPGKLAIAFNFNILDNSRPVFEKDLFIQTTDVHNFDIIASKRIGIIKDADLNLRFYIKNNNNVSRR